MVPCASPPAPEAPGTPTTAGRPSTSPKAETWSRPTDCRVSPPRIWLVLARRATRRGRPNDTVGVTRRRGAPRARESAGSVPTCVPNLARPNHTGISKPVTSTFARSERFEPPTFGPLGGCRRPNQSLASLQSTTRDAENVWSAIWASRPESLLSQPVLRLPCKSCATFGRRCRSATGLFRVLRVRTRLRRV
jgi:hypothetical protein